jgi:hypothetical protein
MSGWRKSLLVLTTTVGTAAELAPHAIATSEIVLGGTASPRQERRPHGTTTIGGKRKVAWRSRFKNKP